MILISSVSGTAETARKRRGAARCGAYHSSTHLDRPVSAAHGPASTRCRLIREPGKGVLRFAPREPGPPLLFITK